MSDFAQLERVSRRRLHERALTELELVIAHRVLDYSYALGSAKARFKRLQFLCAVCGHGKNKISPALSRVESYELVRVDRTNWIIEFCADPARWLVPLRVRPALRAQATEVDAWLRRINVPGMEEQPELWPAEPSLDDALFEVYRESAMAIIGDRRSEVGDQSLDPGEIESLGRSPKGNSVPQKGTTPVQSTGKSTGTVTGNRQAVACQLTVTGTGGVPQKGTEGNDEQSGGDCGSRPSPMLNEQLERLERIVGPGYMGWWRKNAGKSAAHTTALRQTLDDCVTNRDPIRSPSRWLVKTFKNKIQAMGNTCHLW
jgi:hypothetical protein